MKRAHYRDWLATIRIIYYKSAMYARYSWHENMEEGSLRRVATVFNHNNQSLSSTNLAKLCQRDCARPLLLSSFFSSSSARPIPTSSDGDEFSRVFYAR